MKKIININLSGRVIPIEDTAYEKLQAYIESLRRYFANEEGRDEIINDIESRIAELMNEKVRKGASSVTDDDINEIIGSMGRPEDFDAEASEAGADHGKANAGAGTTAQGPKKSKGRLYRDGSDKFIGGVCSGIANYLNTDPAIVRILFAIITFGGFGLGFLIYILLWILLPIRDMEGYHGKRLFRNPDDRIIGGVAGGLSAYFNMKSSTLRLIISAPILLSILFSLLEGLSWRFGFSVFPNIVFGSLTGTFILAYIVLWIVLPEAKSPYDKMEMRGEKVDVNTIRQNVQEGMDNVKDRVKSWGNEIKESAENLGTRTKEFADTRGRQFAADLRDTTRRRGSGIGHAIGVLFKVFFLFIAGTIAFGLFVAVMALIFGGIAWWPVNDFLWTSKWQQAYAWGTLIFFMLVPLVGFIIWVIRRVIGVRSRHSYMGWTFGFLWTIGWVSMILLVASIARDFRIYDSVETDISTSQPANGRMVVLVSEPPLEYSGNFGWIDEDAEGWDLSGDTGRLSTVKFHIVKSPDSAYHVILRKHSYGKTIDDAQRRAEKIQYRVTSRDSVLDLGNGYTIDKESKFRGQQAEVEIQVPAGKKIRFDPTIPEKLNPANFKIKRSYRHRTTINGRTVWNYDYEDGYFRFRTDIDYIMGIDGKLKDPAGRTVNNRDYYRYDDRVNSGDTSVIRQQIEEEKLRQQEIERQQKESEDRLKELEKRQREGRSSTGMSKLPDAKAPIVVLTHSPVLSLVSYL